EKELQALRTRAVEHFAALERADPSWKEFYTGRSAALKALEPIDSRETARQAVSRAPRQAARRALKAGGMPGAADRAYARGAARPEAFRHRLEMLMIHPLVSSGGARHLPKLVAEDVLVEDFPDPKEGDETPPSELLGILGLPSRRGLPRIAIEQALLARGADVMEKHLRLDSRVFRLVCIPPDVHLRLGEP